MKILITGASGSGTTTLGKALSVAINFKHLDVDAYYWKAANPPFQEKISLAEHNENLTNDFQKHKNVIVSGSLVSWGKAWQTAFDLAIFITLDREIRIQRLQQREVERYGEKLQTDSKVKETSEAFIAWAKCYDDPTFTGRSIKIHRDWLNSLSCETLTIDSVLPLEINVSIVLERIEVVS